jgi:hypothetical protein
MNISSLSGSSAVSYVSSVRSQTATQSTDATDTSQQGGAKMSKMGELMSKLRDLQKTDPDKAKAVLAKISQDLKTQAASSGDTRMGELADKFSQASESGDLSVLKPKGPPPGGGHHGGSGSKVGAYQAQQSSGTDPMQQIESIISSDLGN